MSGSLTWGANMAIVRACCQMGKAVTFAQRAALFSARSSGGNARRSRIIWRSSTLLGIGRENETTKDAKNAKNAKEN